MWRKLATAYIPVIGVGMAPRPANPGPAEIRWRLARSLTAASAFAAQPWVNNRYCGGALKALDLKIKLLINYFSLRETA